LLVLGALGAGIAVMSPSSTQSKLEQEAGMRAYYNAQSGLQFIYSRAASSSANNMTGTDFMNLIGNDTSKTYYLPDGGQFTYKTVFSTANSTSANYSITYLAGEVAGSNNNARYTYLLYGGEKGGSSIQQYAPDGNGDTNTEQRAITSGSSITFNGDNYIDTSIYAKQTVVLNGGAVVEGNIISDGYVIINNGTVKKNICMHTEGSSVSWSQQTEVDGDVIVFGDLTLNGGTYKGNLWVTGKLTIQGNAAISKNIYAGTIYINSINLSGDAYATGSINRTGPQYHPNSSVQFPTQCSDIPSIMPRDAPIPSGGADILIQNQSSYAFDYSMINDANFHSIDINSMTLNNSGKTMYFYLSSTGPKGNLDDIAIIANSNITFNKDFAITICLSNDCSQYENFNSSEVSSTMKTYAKYIYLESHGTISFSKGVNWVGTLYGHNFNLNGNNLIVGSIYSTTNGVTLNNNVNIITTSSNFVDTYWK